MFRNIILLLIAVPLWAGVIGAFMMHERMDGRHSDMKMMGEKHEMMGMNKENKDQKTDEDNADTKKITITDLDPVLVEELNASFQALNEGIVGSQMGTQEISFFVGKLLEKNYSEAELNIIMDEYKKLLEEALAEAESENISSEASVPDTLNILKNNGGSIDTIVTE